MRIREIIVNKPIAPTFSFDAYIEKPRNNYLFFDIETLGFHRQSHPVILIGALEIKGNTLQLTQWIGDSIADEKELLETFFDSVTKDTVLVSFNGKRFDWPFLSSRAKKHRILPPTPYEHIDLFQFYRGGFAHLDVESHTLRELTKTHFQFQSVESREIPALLQDHLTQKTSPGRLQALFLHNEEDLCSMLALEERMSEILPYWQIQLPDGILSALSLRTTDDYYLVRYRPSTPTLAHNLISQGKNYAIDWVREENLVEFKFRYLTIENRNRLFHLIPEQWLPFTLPQSDSLSQTEEIPAQFRILMIDDQLDRNLIHKICQAIAFYIQ